MRRSVNLVLNLILAKIFEVLKFLREKKTI